MVLTKTELIASLRNEVRILLHLAGKIDPAALEYRPTAKQRSTFELLKYLAQHPCRENQSPPPVIMPARSSTNASITGQPRPRPPFEHCDIKPFNAF